MSVCIVAAYPWQRIAGRQGLGAPGVVIASDTRVTYGKTIGPWLLAKQSLVARNILVCYTSSHAQATSLALHRSNGQRDLKRIGIELVRAHGASGGFTELIAVIWRGHSAPQVLELMPPRYMPAKRTGIIGIGDSAVLEWFRENFRAELEPETEFRDFEIMAQSWERQFGKKLEMPAPSLPIETAATHVVGALSRAIQLVGGPTVSLPLQLMTVTLGRVHQHQAISSENLQVWDDITTHQANTRLATPKPGIAPVQTGKRTSVQLLL